MRSNDIVWGLPYDVFLFTMLQELLASELSVDIGSYFHYAASFHLYERHFKLAEEILSVDDGICSPMIPMAAIDEIPSFLRCEVALRSGVPLAEIAGVSELASYWRSLLEPLEGLRRQRLDGNG
jgi:thymidylate synthase